MINVCCEQLLLRYHLLMNPPATQEVLNRLETVSWSVSEVYGQLKIMHVTFGCVVFSWDWLWMNKLCVGCPRFLMTSYHLWINNGIMHNHLGVLACLLRCMHNLRSISRTFAKSNTVFNTVSPLPTIPSAKYQENNINTLTFMGLWSSHDKYTCHWV